MLYELHSLLELLIWPYKTSFWGRPTLRIFFILSDVWLRAPRGKNFCSHCNCFCIHAEPSVDKTWMLTGCLPSYQMVHWHVLKVFLNFESFLTFYKKESLFEVSYVMKSNCLKKTWAFIFTIYFWSPNVGFHSELCFQASFIILYKICCLYCCHNFISFIFKAAVTYCLSHGTNLHFLWSTLGCHMLKLV
jgi:hypothetical protein